MSRKKEELTEEMNRKKHEEEQAKHRMQRAKNRKEYLETTLRKQRTIRWMNFFPKFVPIPIIVHPQEY